MSDLNKEIVMLQEQNKQLLFLVNYYENAIEPLFELANSDEINEFLNETLDEWVCSERIDHLNRTERNAKLFLHRKVKHVLKRLHNQYCEKFN